MKFLLDTNVIREIGRKKPQVHVGNWLDSVDDADLAISVVTVKEVAKGIAKLTKAKPGTAAEIEKRTSEVFDAFDGRILPVDRQVAAAWGEMLGQSEKHVDDACLAATALVHDLTVVTRNTADFIGRGVRSLDPYKSPAERLPK
jgi:predicted nucleic acid-binding protein